MKPAQKRGLVCVICTKLIVENDNGRFRTLYKILCKHGATFCARKVFISLFKINLQKREFYSLILEKLLSSAIHDQQRCQNLKKEPLHIMRTQVSAQLNHRKILISRFFGLKQSRFHTLRAASRSLYTVGFKTWHENTSIIYHFISIVIQIFGIY